MMKTFRLYYKKSRGIPFIWSVDTGHISSQKVVTDFHIGTGCEVVSGKDFTSGIPNSPEAFIVINCSEFYIKDDEAYFVSFNSD